MIKSILGGKSKNLFDISKVVQSARLKNNGNGTLTVSAYGVSAGILKDLCPNIKVGDTIKAYYTPISWTAPNPPRVISINNHIFDIVGNPSFVVTEVDLNGKVYFYNNNYTERNLPGTTVIGNIFITNDTTVTAANYKDRYVPYEITSYKSIMKVSDVCQLVDKSKFTASGTVNGITWVSNGDGSITLNGTCTGGFALNPFNQQIPVDQTHFYYSSPYLSINYGGRIDGTYETGRIGYIKAAAHPTKFNTVFYIWIDKDMSFSNVTTFINIDDLTEMFGAGNEPKTVDEFKAKFPNDYYPYSPNRFVTSYDERMSCKTKNLFDKSNAQIINGYISASNVFRKSSNDKTIIIPCLPNTTYTFSKISLSPVAYDRLRIGDYTAIPAIGDTINNVVNIGEPPTQNYITITTSDTAKYIVVTIGLFYPTVITTLDYILNTCQLELGTTATDYVPYGYV